MKIIHGSDQVEDGCFIAMPKDMPELTADEAQLVREWIEAGAKP